MANFIQLDKKVENGKNLSDKLYTIEGTGTTYNVLEKRHLEARACMQGEDAMSTNIPLNSI
jgi:hypothetical protein